MEVLWILLVGACIGVLAKLVMPGRELGGMLVTSLLGVLGAFVAFALGRACGLFGVHDAPPMMLASVAGSVLVLFLYRVLANPGLQR